MPIDDSDLEIRRFDPSRHDRAGFDCGVERLNNYLRLTAKKQQADDMTRVYVALRAGENRILGYHAINLGTMDISAMDRRPRGAPAHGDIPVLFLGQIAVCRSAQGGGIGKILMHHVFQKASVVADHAGCHAVLLDIVADGGEAAFARRKAWYKSFGFQSFASSPSRMFITMKAVRAAIRL